MANLPGLKPCGSQAAALQTRPFGLSPGTRFMTTDGIIIAGQERAELGAFLVNQTSHALEQVQVECEFTPNSGIKVLSSRAELTRLLPHVPTLVTFAIDTTASRPGKYGVTMSIAGLQRDGLEVRSSAEGRVFVAVSVGGFFEHLGHEEDGVDVPRVWTNVVPEGAITTEIIEFHEGAPSQGGGFPVALRMCMVPHRPFQGQFSPIPFEDPIWKAVGAVIELGAVKLGAAAVVGTVIGVGAGGAAAASGAGKKAAVGITVVTALAVTGAILMFADGEDVFLWGERQTPVDDDEYTIREEGEARLIVDGSPPRFGRPKQAKAEWFFKRVTSRRTLTARKVMSLTPSHYTTGRSVSVNEQTFYADQSVQITAHFEKDGSTLRGSDLYVVATLTCGEQVVAAFPLSDDGTVLGTEADAGRYVGEYLISENDPVGEWDVIVTAQDVNHANPDDPPLKQAESLGGIFVSVPELNADFRPIPDAKINVIEALEVRTVGVRDGAQHAHLAALGMSRS